MPGLLFGLKIAASQNRRGNGSIRRDNGNAAKVYIMSAIRFGSYIARIGCSVHEDAVAEILPCGIGVNSSCALVEIWVSGGKGKGTRDCTATVNGYLGKSTMRSQANDRSG